VIGQIAVDDTSNESTAIPKLLDLLSLRGCMVTIDVMGCQTTISAKIPDGQGHYVLALKANQTALHADVQAFFADERAAKQQEYGMTIATETISGRSGSKPGQYMSSATWR
jgi:predicted transposase YbfD/YdcC